MKKEKREIIIILVLSFIAFAFAFAFGRSESKLIKCREQVKGQQEKINQLKKIK